MHRVHTIFQLSPVPAWLWAPVKVQMHNTHVMKPSINMVCCVVLFIWNTAKSFNWQESRQHWEEYPHVEALTGFLLTHERTRDSHLSSVIAKQTEIIDAILTHKMPMTEALFSPVLHTGNNRWSKENRIRTKQYGNKVGSLTNVTTTVHLCWLTLVVLFS